MRVDNRGAPYRPRAAQGDSTRSYQLSDLRRYPSRSSYVSSILDPAYHTDADKYSLSCGHIACRDWYVTLT